MAWTPMSILSNGMVSPEKSKSSLDCPSIRPSGDSFLLRRPRMCSMASTCENEAAGGKRKGEDRWRFTLFSVLLCSLSIRLCDWSRNSESLNRNAQMSLDQSAHSWCDQRVPNRRVPIRPSCPRRIKRQAAYDNKLDERHGSSYRASVIKCNPPTQQIERYWLISNQVKENWERILCWTHRAVWIWTSWPEPSWKKEAWNF